MWYVLMLTLFKMLDVPSGFGGMTYLGMLADQALDGAVELVRCCAKQCQKFIQSRHTAYLAPPGPVSPSRELRLILKARVPPWSLRSKQV